MISSSLIHGISTRHCLYPYAVQSRPSLLLPSGRADPSGQFITSPPAAGATRRRQARQRYLEKVDHVLGLQAEVAQQLEHGHARAQRQAVKVARVAQRVGDGRVLLKRAAKSRQRCSPAAGSVVSVTLTDLGCDFS